VSTNRKVGGELRGKTLERAVGTTKKLFLCYNQSMADIPKKIMVIEDDTFLSSLMKARLEKEGFTVIQAFNGEEAIETLKTEVPDVIILDLIMPKVTGFEVLQNISISPQLAKVIIIVLSNLAQDSDVEKARQFGAKEYFVKVKVSIDDLVGKIKGLLVA
jgi:two-component system, OmpR family, phosphate regulon response regulator PhoB